MTNKYTTNFFLNKISKLPRRKVQDLPLVLTSKQLVTLGELINSRLNGASLDLILRGCSNVFPHPAKTAKTRVIAALKQIADETGKYSPRKAA